MGPTAKPTRMMTSPFPARGGALKKIVLPSEGRRGFTLVELLLAIAILAGLAAVVIPSFTSLLADRSLQRSGDQMRVEMMRTRLAAMRSGRTYLLQVKPDTGEVRVKPWFDYTDMTEAVDQTGGSQALLTGGNVVAGAMQTEDPETATRMVELPADVLVGSAQIESTPRSFLIDTQLQGESADGWSLPILFFPDGSTSNASITLTHTEAGRIVVRVRGLTGELSVSDVLAAEGG